MNRPLNLSAFSFLSSNTHLSEVAVDHTRLLLLQSNSANLFVEEPLSKQSTPYGFRDSLVVIASPAEPLTSQSLNYFDDSLSGGWMYVIAHP